VSAVSHRLQLPNDQDASGRDFGEEELELLREVLASGTLTSTKGTKVASLEREFAARYNVHRALACSSGSAAVHVALAAIDPEPGDEVVTSPITDMGALTPIVYQGAIPVFCDVDPDSYNVTARTIEARLTERTRAVVVTHLFGVPCEMAPIMELCRARGVPVIEDCAQAFDASYQGRPVGTFGAIGCFSLQQGKHMSCGEGGLVITNDEALARRMFLFINKAWGYGDPQPDHYFLALNYRMNELSGAVALAQLRKLSSVVTRRGAAARRLLERIQGLPGVTPQAQPPASDPVYWKFCVNVDEATTGVSVTAVAARMKEAGIHAAPRYIGKPAFECRIFREQVTLGRSRWPFTHPSRAALPPVDYDLRNFPGTARALSQVLVIPWNERYSDEHVDYIAEHLRAAVGAR
jgi:perosamine synthetase